MKNNHIPIPNISMIFLNDIPNIRVGRNVPLNVRRFSSYSCQRMCAQASSKVLTLNKKSMFYIAK